ncbi:Jag N-terminal domain-containing protein [Sulfurovum sp. XGS-02]|uniref:Jag N-terminal domain-containing protein n=1 Tax=Sulfurovum sp. XGS-02 TaxID=2925411 RepID=UPI00204CB023|nr:Jag N-terminal domain-containing protein [Sulfurovum sp. XGS-02]UPT76833.1 Jag N-terminal domain-containing protein [Sulfurovum sp. XGS-02]
MKKVEAPTLEEAYQQASQMLGCSVSELQSEVIQHPSKGFLGLLKKSAIIVATCQKTASSHTKNELKKEASPLPTAEENVASEIIAAVKEEQATHIEPEIEKDAIVDSFFEADHYSDDLETFEEETVVYDELALMIEDQLKELLSHSCFDIDVVEVDVRDNTALIFIDGEDAALLIGKEGYRYNALSYMLFNWLHAKYELFIKLEIAEFLTTQQEMIRNYIKPVIEHVEKQGKGKTRFLDGILVQIALEQLRERFPDKYVAVKTAREGKKFVVINEFNNNKSHA